MFRNRVYILLSVLWLASLLLSTVGINVHRIYCYCIGESRISLFYAESECAGQEVFPSCCKPKPVSCCSANAGKEACDTQSDHSSDCTRKSTDFIRLKTDLQTEFFSFKTFDLKDIIAVAEAPVVLAGWVSSLPPVFKKPIRPTPTPPPSPSGRTLSQRCQVFRC